jgi:uncharacterized protein (DUF2062 family)
MGQRLRRWQIGARKVLRRVLYSKSSPSSIAGGMALGIFVGLTPMFGFQMILAAFLGALFRVNIVAAVAGVWITNPLTAVPIYYAEYQLGALILPYAHGSHAAEGIALVARKFGEISLVEFWRTLGAAIGAFFGMGNEVILRLLTGSVIIATVLSALTYPFSLWWVSFYRRRRQVGAVRRADARLKMLSAAGLVHVAPPPKVVGDDSGELAAPQDVKPRIVPPPEESPSDERPRTGGCDGPPPRRQGAEGA